MKTKMLLTSILAKFKVGRKLKLIGAIPLLIACIATPTIVRADQYYLDTYNGVFRNRVQPFKFTVIVADNRLKVKTHFRELVKQYPFNNNYMNKNIVDLDGTQGPGKYVFNLGCIGQKEGSTQNDKVPLKQRTFNTDINLIEVRRTDSLLFSKWTPVGFSLKEARNWTGNWMQEVELKKGPGVDLGVWTSGKTAGGGAYMDSRVDVFRASFNYEVITKKDTCFWVGLQERSPRQADVSQIMLFLGIGEGLNRTYTYYPWIYNDLLTIEFKDQRWLCFME